MIYLEPQFLKIVKTILNRNMADRKVVVFGSRATGKHKKHSDLDICIIGDTPLSLKELAHLREDFSESDLPIRVDIVDWATLSTEFKSIVQSTAIPLN